MNILITPDFFDTLAELIEKDSVILPLGRAHYVQEVIRENYENLYPTLWTKTNNGVRLDLLHPFVVEIEVDGKRHQQRYWWTTEKELFDHFTDVCERAGWTLICVGEDDRGAR